MKAIVARAATAANNPFFTFLLLFEKCNTGTAYSVPKSPPYATAALFDAIYNHNSMLLSRHSV
jgi:hypothetical protein